MTAHLPAPVQTADKIVRQHVDPRVRGYHLMLTELAFLQLAP